MKAVGNIFTSSDAWGAATRHEWNYSSRSRIEWGEDGGENHQNVHGVVMLMMRWRLIDTMQNEWHIWTDASETITGLLSKHRVVPKAVASYITACDDRKDDGFIDALDDHQTHPGRRVPREEGERRSKWQRPFSRVTTLTFVHPAAGSNCWECSSVELESRIKSCNRCLRVDVPAA